MSVIVIVSAVFTPEPIVSAQTSAQLADALLKQNHTIRVITDFPNRPAGKLYPGFHRQFYSKSNISTQYSILRCFSTISKKSSIFSRFLENISFGVTSGLALLFFKKPDVIYANTWPIFAIGLVRLISSLRKIPLVISVQDVYPESLVVQGRLKEHGIVYYFLSLVDRWIARGCKKVIVISKQFAQIYIEKRSIGFDRIAVVPNWIEKNSITLLPQTIYRKEQNIDENAFVLVYGGNIGTAADVKSLLRSFKDIRINREIVFIIAGAGSQLEECRMIAKEIDNILCIIHSPWEIRDTSKVLAAADILILPTNGNQSLVSMPSKLMTYMLASRPVLALALSESTISQIINQTGCGWVVRAGDYGSVVRKIEELANTPKEILNSIGKRGREYALENMVEEVCLPKIIKIIAEATGK